jgi:hypothetical protein
MLFLIIDFVWLAAALLTLAACRGAARGDAGALDTPALPAPSIEFHGLRVWDDVDAARVGRHAVALTDAPMAAGRRLAHAGG